MALIEGTTLALTDTVINGGGILLDRPTSGATATINGVTYLYAPAETTNSIQIFTVSSEGQLTPVANLVDNGGITLDGIEVLVTFEVDGNPFLAAAGADDEGITVFALTDTAPYLTFADRALDSDNAAFEIDRVQTMSVADFGTETVLLAAGFTDDGISSFLVGSDGALTNVTNIDDASDPDLQINAPWMGDVFIRGSASQYVAVGGESDSGFSIFFVNGSSGVMTEVASFDGGADSIRPLQTVGKTIGNTTYLFGADFFGSAVHLFEWNGGSTIDLVQSVSSPLLQQLVQTKILEVGERIFFVSSSYSASGVAVFEFDPLFGTLTAAQIIADNNGEGALSRAHLGTEFEVDGTRFLMVAGENDDTLNIYEIGGGDEVLEGTLVSDDINGGSGDNIIYGLNGNDTIDGGRGNDVIYAGSGNDLVSLSTGEDVLFGGSGEDSLDAGAFDDVTGGVTIDFLRDTVRLPDGSIQSIDSFEIAFGTARADLLVGDDKDNVLIGEGGGDVLRGRDGNDAINGGDGEDRLFGAGGDDELFAGNGKDLINGGSGVDFIDAGGADDRVFAGSGDDVIDGGAGSDRIKGNDGNDTIDGGAGSDFLEGQSGDDTIDGGDGNDIILGGSGRDRIIGGSGADTLTGGSAIDTFVFVPVILGGGGNNTITDFNDGVDQLDFIQYGFSAPSILSLASQSGSDTVISFVDGQIVRLLDFAVGDLDTSDIIV